MRRSILLLVLLSLLAAGAAPAETSKLDARARAALAGLRSGMTVPQLRAAAAAVSATGDLDVFIVGDVTRAALEAAGARVRIQAGDVFTAYVPPEAMDAVAALAGVRSIQGAAPCEEELDASVPATGASLLRGPGPAFAGVNGAGVLVGDVDSGLDYHHGDFRNPDGSTRLVTLWDQTDAGGPAPAGYAYGSEWTRADLNASIARELDTSGHGTHVMGILGGDGSETGGGVAAYTYAGMAPRADLFFVKTTMMSSDVLDGVHYLFDQATARGENAAVNLSLGSMYGPHDGTSAFETGLNALSGPGRIVAVSAGNNRYNATTNPSYLHAGFNLPAGGDSAKLNVSAGGTTSGRIVGLDGYYGAGNQVSVTIRTPGNFFIGPIAFSSVNAPYPGQVTGVNGQVYVENGVALTATGDREVYLELKSLGAGTGSINGTWTFYFTPVSMTGSDRVDVWRFYHSSTSLASSWSLKGTNTHLLGEPAGADSVISVASWTSKRYWTDCGPRANINFTGAVNPGALSPFSSPGPTRTGGQKPDIAAPGSAIGSALTQDVVLSCGATASTYLPDGLKHYVNQGTSMAAPHVTGALGLLMQKYGAISPSWAKAWLRTHALVDAYVGTPWNGDWGWGKLTLGDLLDPAVAVTAPNGGEVLILGTAATLTWTATDNVGVTAVDVLLSRTGDAGPFETIATGVANTGSLPWTVAGTPSEDCRLKVVARDAEGNVASDLSDASFAVLDAATPTLLSLFTATPVPAGIELRWQFASGTALAGLAVERSSGEAGPWSATAVRVRAESGEQVAVDGAVEPGRTYWYRLTATMGATPVTFGPIRATAGEVIAAVALARPVPNPTSGGSRVELALPREARVHLALYDMQGRRVASLVEGTLPAGRHQAAWNGLAEGRAAAPGVYLVRLRADGVDLVRRLVVTR